MKRLLVLVAKAQRAIWPFWYDAKLHSFICSSVLVKLPTKLRGQFISLFGHNAACWSVRDLRRFLQDLIVEHYQLVDREITKNNDQWCQYCKRAGHLKANCYKRQSLLCYACFQYGHSSKRCIFLETAFKTTSFAELFGGNYKF